MAERKEGLANDVGNCGFCNYLQKFVTSLWWANSLYCLLGLYVLMIQAAMFEGSMWQEIESCQWSTSIVNPIDSQWVWKPILPQGACRWLVSVFSAACEIPRPCSRGFSWAIPRFQTHESGKGIHECVVLGQSFEVISHRSIDN